jgi:hypothetical protein
LALPCGGPTSGLPCTLSAEVPFEAFRDDSLLATVLMRAGWVLSVVTAKDAGAKTVALMPLCPGCAKAIHGDKLIEAARERLK